MNRRIDVIYSPNVATAVRSNKYTTMRIMFSCLFSESYCVYACIFVISIEFFPYCLSVSNSQVTGCEERLRNDQYCVGWGVKLYSIQSKGGRFFALENDKQRKCNNILTKFN